MNDILMVMVSYVAVIVIAFFVINWLQRGLLINFLLVKSSRGKKVLCKVRGKVEDYYTPAEPKDSGLILKFKNDKEKSTLTSVPSSCYYRSAGVTMVDVDEVSKFAVSKDWTAINTSDPIIMTNLIKRAQMTAREQDKLIIVVIVMIVAVILGLLIIGVMVNDVKTIVKGFQAGAEVIGSNL